jgi:methyltransferase (TIGR00027 family)
MFQATPAAFHGRQDLSRALTDELRALLSAPEAEGAVGPEAALTGVGNTARWIAASRAKESELALPLFSDPYARELSGEAGFELQRHMRAAMGAQGDGPDLYLSIRTKFLDDALVAAVRTRELHQVVILAAGMDTRAFRIPWPSGVKVFEVDRDEIFDHKEAVLGRAGASPSCDRHIVRADLARSWTATLTLAGFDRTKPAAFLVEGLLMYLEEHEALPLLAAIGEIAAPGSWIAADIVNPEVLTSPYMARYMAALREAGSPWKFGIEDPESFFRQRGWAATVVQPGDPEASFGRWPFPTAPRGVPGMPRTFFVTAGKAS